MLYYESAAIYLFSYFSKTNPKILKLIYNLKIEQKIDENYFCNVL